MERVIRTTGELEGLRPRGARRGIERVSLEMGLREDAKQRLEGVLNHGLRSCGCETGAVFVFTGLVAQLGAALASGGRMHWPSAGELGRFTALLLALGLAGKISGLIAAEWRFRRAIDELLLGPQTGAR